MASSILASSGFSESAIVESPQLAEKLRGLTLGALTWSPACHTTGSVDVSARVTQHIQSRNRQRGFLPCSTSAPRLAANSAFGSALPPAASLMVAASLAIMVQTSQFEAGQPVASLLANNVVQSNPQPG